MGKIQLIASDIDGTLLPFGKDRLSERVREDLVRLLDAGVHVVPASGRLISAIPGNIMDMPGLRYVITSNGASVIDLATGRSIYERRIPAAMAARVLRRLEKYDAYSCVYLPGEVHNRGELHPGIPVYYSNRVAFFSRNPHDDLPGFVEERGEDAEKIFLAIFDPREREKIRRELEEFPGIHVTSSSQINLEINHVQAEKGAAVAWLAERLLIPRENVAAMGDNENDLSMLLYAGTAVAPANAVPAVRQAASEIVPDCREAGAAVFLERVLEEYGTGAAVREQKRQT